MKLKEMMEKYKDIVPYAIFGILTTIINIVVYLFFAHILKKEVMLSTLAAWFLSVLFAYVTNRKWVFHSGVLTFSNIIREAVAFFICRLATGIADILIMFIFVNIFHVCAPWARSNGCKSRTCPDSGKCIAEQQGCLSRGRI